MTIICNGASSCKVDVISALEVPEQSNGMFRKFPALPCELQIKIWKLAIPRIDVIGSRTGSDGILVVVLDFNFNKLRGILPSIREFKRAYQLANPHHVDEEMDMYMEIPTWDYDDNTWANARRPILSLLHTCRTARSLTQEVYHLDLDSTIPNETRSFWADENVVSFYPSRQSQETRAMIYWLSQRQNRQALTFHTIRHLALHLDLAGAYALGVYGDHSYPGEEYEMGSAYSNQLLQRLPSLQRLILLIDPFYRIILTKTRREEAHTMTWHKPNDGPILRMWEQRPSQIRREMAEILKLSVQEGRELPQIEVLIYGDKEVKSQAPCQR
ncbi:hypothetical protein F5884DRAFT_830276 [Xylogone sp. PMI_703]|nr:hypothetical protein F5884DRAFT_830276 [Xylogone sp. PMI_703]